MLNPILAGFRELRGCRVTINISTEPIFSFKMAKKYIIFFFIFLGKLMQMLSDIVDYARGTLFPKPGQNRVNVNEKAH